MLNVYEPFEISLHQSEFGITVSGRAPLSLLVLHPAPSNLAKLLTTTNY